jgi:O-antigen/teichoic acid export membrane protein
MSLTAKNTLRNTALLVAFEVANPLLSLLLVGTMTRRLGAEGTGAYNLLLYFFFVAHSVTSLGLNSLITREVARERSAGRAFLCTSGTIGVLVSLAVAAGTVGVIHLAHYGAEIQQGGWLVALALLPSIMILYSEAVFIAFEKVQYIVLMAVLENCGRVLVGLWLLHRGSGIVPLVASFTFFRFVTLAVNLAFFHRRIGRLSWQFDPQAGHLLVRSIPVFGTIFIVATLYQRADVFLLSKMETIAAVGFYTVGYRLFSIAQVVPKSFNTTIYPVFSKLFLHSPETFRNANSLSIRYMLVVMLPIAAGISSLAGPLVRLLFGADFGPAAGVLRVVIWTLVPYGIVRILASSLFASNRQAVDLKVNLMGLATNLLLNLALIPRFGIRGCAWATVVSSFCFLGFQCLFLRREIGPILRHAEIVRPALATAALVLCLWLTPALPLFLRIFGGALVYVALIIAMQVVRLRELRAVLPHRLLVLLPEEHEP